MPGNAALAGPQSLLRVADAWRNRPALTTLSITFVAAALVGLFCLGYGTSAAVPFPVGLCVALIGFGLTAAGSQYAEQADGRPVSSVSRAFAATPAIALRVFLLAALVAAVFLAFVLVASGVLFACRLPVVGPLLYAVAVPVLTLCAAVLLLATCAALLLTLPALWEGHSLRTALSQLGAIAAQRKREAFANLILLFLVVGAVAAVVLAFVLAAFGLTTVLAARFFPVAGFDRVLAPGAGQPWLVGAEPVALAASVGTAVVLAITSALLSAVFLFGLAIAYLRSTEGIDIAAARAALGRAIVEVQVRSGQAADEAGRLAGRLRATIGSRYRLAAHGALAGPPGMATQAGASSSADPCAECGSPAAQGDVFCGHCGRRLQG